MHEMSDTKIKKGPAATYSPATNAVPSALEGLTTVFGMGTGMAPPLWPPGQDSSAWEPPRCAARRAPGGKTGCRSGTGKTIWSSLTAD